jgi:hypothetical protein
MVAGPVLAWVVAEFLGQVGWREGEAKHRGKQLLLPLFFVCPGEEEGLWCRSKRHPLLISLFFLKQCMKRRRFTQNTPFYLKGNGAKACQS